MRKHRRIFVACHLLIFCLFLLHTLCLPGLMSQETAGSRIKAMQQEGMDFFSRGEYVRAIERFTQVLALADDRETLSEVYYHLSLASFFLKDLESAKAWTSKLLELKPDMMPFPGWPVDYRSLFLEMKGQRGGVTQEQALQPSTDTILGPEAPTPAKKRSSGFVLIGALVLGAVVVAGVVYFVFMGSYDVRGEWYFEERMEGNSTWFGGTMEFTGARYSGNCYANHELYGSYSVVRRNITIEAADGHCKHRGAFESKNRMSGTFITTRLELKGEWRAQRT